MHLSWKTSYFCFFLYKSASNGPCSSVSAKEKANPFDARKKWSFFDATRKKPQPTIHSWAIAKQLIDWILCNAKKIYHSQLNAKIPTMASIHEKKRAHFKGICCKCPLFHGSFVWIVKKYSASLAQTVNMIRNSKGYSK